MINTANYKRYSADPVGFISDLRIDVSGTVHRWGDVMDQFQRDDFAALSPGMLRCAGRLDDPTARLRFWSERPRGASKSTDQAAVMIWLLVFGTRPLRLLAYAADREQAAILKAAMVTIIRLNPWLGSILEVQSHSVENIAAGHPALGAMLTIEASDAASSYGQLPNAVCADEVTHWPEKAGSDLFSSIISSVAKRSNCLLACICNSGFVDSFAWRIREAVRQDPEHWIFSRLEGQASWMTEERLAEQRKLLPPVAFARLWLNQWSSGGGDALTPEDIAAAFQSDVQPIARREPGWLYVAGVDLGLTRDGSAVVVLAVPYGGVAGKIRLAHHELFRPVAGRKLDLMEIERHILSLDARLGLEYIVADPWQAELLCQRLEADSNHKRRNMRKFYTEPWVRTTPPTASNLRQQAALTIECFQDRRMQLFEGEALRRDLTRLRVEEKNNGFRLVSPRDEFGHGDSARLCPKTGI